MDFDINDILDGGDEVSTAVEITSPSGNAYKVANQAEADYYDNVGKKYQKDNVFSNVSDVLELDRILIMELMVYRWGLWLLAESDYEGAKIDVDRIQKSIETYSKEIRGIKKDLGLDKASRDRDSGESIAKLWQQLKLHAKEFGVHRDNQILKSVTLWKELQGLITLHDNSTESERTEFGVSMEQIVEWIRLKFVEFDEIDEAFRKNQRLWIRDINS